MRTNKGLANLSPVLGVLLPFLVGSCGYKPCSDLEIGDRFEVTIEEIYFGSDCRPEFELGVGSTLEFEVTDTVEARFCESTTGKVVDPSGQLRFKNLNISSDDHPSGGFFGEYEVTSAQCSGSAEISLAENRKGLSVDICSNSCESECSFNADVESRRQ